MACSNHYWRTVCINTVNKFINLRRIKAIRYGQQREKIEKKNIEKQVETCVPMNMNVHVILDNLIKAYICVFL